ncbi:proline-rich receptor-like protein kinase PERK2 [Ictidomys tridecemlineatus]|uniref:proline-rich receptor-like protein kinase PERK2 n=1 Tax=Ictidomys tridecemlineatus TaxID=43179 RepID=UPI00068168E1|nr:proline-rich receptor-like protein kinase PERK2 [Ictidomys tridecemlineatus]KAG3294294.1 proline-rich receptor-like protein kinase PERK2 [Ictidomys tridecemlineatus]
MPRAIPAPRHLHSPPARSLGWRSVREGRGGARAGRGTGPAEPPRPPAVRHRDARTPLSPGPRELCLCPSNFPSPDVPHTSTAPECASRGCHHRSTARTARHTSKPPRSSRTPGRRTNLRNSNLPPLVEEARSPELQSRRRLSIPPLTNCPTPRPAPGSPPRQPPASSLLSNRPLRRPIPGAHSLSPPSPSIFFFSLKVKRNK